TIHALPLLRWLPQQPVSITWWLWGAVGVLVLLTANTLFCSVESVLRKRTVSQWLLIISPQVIHIGFLFILLAHLMSAISGFKGVTAAREGTVLALPGGVSVGIGPISLALDSYGYIHDWTVDIEYVAEGKVVRRDRLMPNAPSFFEGLGIYVKDLRAFPDRAVLLELSREPGAVWALIGGILFAAGTVTLLGLKVKRE
ncbi:MAG TPA: hypothetical protein VF790_10865, partial [Dissulfurispiraceae bacterium]